MAQNARSERLREGMHPTSGTRERIDTYSVGYHQTFKTRSEPLPPPPSYTSMPSQRRGIPSSLPSFSSQPSSEPLPKYHCTLSLSGMLDLRREFTSPFDVSIDKSWYPVHALLSGTQLSFFRVSKPIFKGSLSKRGRLLRTYSLQHAEVGIALDWKGGELVPKTKWTRLLSKGAQRKLWESDPAKFEPIREFVLRLRVETEQLILCASTQESMLDWVEQISAGLDLAMPLEDRSMPRYRSLPRRSRRQRQIEEAALQSPLSRDEEERRRAESDRRLVAEQERLIRSLYPHLATNDPNECQNDERRNEGRQNEECQNEERQDIGEDDSGQDPDAADLDPADAREDTPLSRPTTRELHTPATHRSTRDTYDPKTASPRSAPTTESLIRLRRRCAPILLATTPRASPIIYDKGQRYHIDVRKLQLSPFIVQPPRYSATANTAMGERLTASPPKASDLTRMELETIQHVTEDHSKPRPGLDRGLSGATFASASSSWTSSNEAEVDESVGSEEIFRGPPRPYRSLEELERVDSRATDKGKGRAVMFIRDLSVLI
jgi:hypothetical protein